MAESESEDSSQSNEDFTWEDILGNGKLLKKTLQPGSGGRPTMGNDVSVAFEVFPFDEPDADFDTLVIFPPPFQKEISFYLGDGGANLNALELSVALMNVGETAVIKCTNPKLCFDGEPPEFRPQSIDPSSNLFIRAKLLADEGPPLPWPERPRPERLKYAENKIERGNAYCRAGIFGQAINSYTSALKVVGYAEEADDEDNNDEGGKLEEDTSEDDIRLKAFSGLSTAHFNTYSFDNALKSCDDALNLKPDSAKLIFRRGRALAQLGRFQEACEAMTAAKLISQEDSNGLSSEFLEFVYKELARVHGLVQKEKKKEADLYRKMIPVKPLPPPSAFKKLFYSSTGVFVGATVVLLASFCLWFAVNN